MSPKLTKAKEKKKRTQIKKKEKKTKDKKKLRNIIELPLNKYSLETCKASKCLVTHQHTHTHTHTHRHVPAITPEVYATPGLILPSADVNDEKIGLRDSLNTNPAY